ncbi:FtsH protease activity modulator HflK [Ruminobacter sp. RM87]|uniref:FtsH protease activity modulator HflK n=1 Tax=Ruminobacter sp. RM87 TaxID=1200567 RepID=UPI0004E19E6D|nr:FtsH protease activity modulator HflK [Ruminobacter sp. RM87]
MAWNEPNNNDPWKQQQKRNNANDLSKKLNDFFDKSSFLSWIIFLAVVLFFIVINNFYTVKEAEEAVVLRFGKFSHIEMPGLHWKIPLVDKVTKVDVQIVQSTKSVGSMLTEDENVVNVEMEVQYKISDPRNYLYNMVDPDTSLTQATDSALRYVIGHTKMDDVLTNGREQVRQSTEELLKSIISQYDMGISIVNVNFLPARAPDQVKAAFDDAIAAQEDEQRFKREAEAYRNEVVPKAEGQAKRILEEAEGYSRKVVAKAEGDVARFERVLPEYNAAPQITKRRIFLETMENVYGNSAKVIISADRNGASPLMYMPVDKLIDSINKSNSGENRNGGKK